MIILQVVALRSLHVRTPVLYTYVCQRYGLNSPDFIGVRPRKLVQQPINMCNGQINATIMHFEGDFVLVNVYQDELSNLLSGPLTAPFQPL